MRSGQNVRSSSKLFCLKRPSRKEPKAKLVLNKMLIIGEPSALGEIAKPEKKPDCFSEDQSDVAFYQMASLAPHPSLLALNYHFT